ncbi:hypothetical protein EDB84DRAFT_1581129 [Lactarius hengduanensis]|nr:hypothetical protein EDB84DRAFT_1581129 [Lactarius hengduanensis]
MIPGSAVADIRNSLGIAFIGLLISTTLYGLTILQTWVYFCPRNYGKGDTKALKLFVIFITVTDTINIILGAYTIYWYLVLNFGDVESLDHVLWSLSAQTANGAVALASLQMFVVRTLPLTCYLSNEAKPLRKTSLCRSDSIVMTLMAYTINTGLLTSLLGTAAIISVVVSPSSMIWLAFCWVMNGCSTNSMLALLNSRDHIRGRTSADKAFSLSSIRYEQRSEAHGSKPRQTGVSVTVHHSATSDLSRNNFGPNVKPTFEVPKPDASIAPFKSPVVVQL